MKKETTKQNTTESQIRCSIKDTFAGTRVKLNQLNLKVTATNGDFNIFLNQNLGKGPPGRTRSPVAARGHPPAGEARPPENKAGPPDSNSTNYNKVQLIITNTKFNLLQTFNSLIMKKQILFIALFVLAVFASVNRSYGQTATHFSGPQALVSCTNDALHPIAGKPYDYTVASDGTAPTFTWWATNSTDYITAGVLQNTTANVLVSPDVVPTTAAQYNSGINTSATIQLTWGTTVLANAMKAIPVPAFVAVYSIGTSCADNLKVYKVNPINAFMVDIKNIDDAKLVAGVLAVTDTLTYAAAESQCYAKVQGAKWAANKMIYDYGTNVLYFEVVASNFTGTWTPTFTLSGLKTGQTAAMVWAYTPAFASPVTITSGTATTDVTTAVTNTSKGVSIFVKVTVSNNTWEGITAGGDPITLTVSGKNSALQTDVKATDCTLADVNTAFQTINARPIITGTTVVGTFELP